MCYVLAGKGIFLHALTEALLACAIRLSDHPDAAPEKAGQDVL